MRNDRLDILKAIGIILVVWGHITPIFAGYIYTFHMPLFFFVTGFLRFGKKEKPWKTFIWGKFKTTIIPYIGFWIISVVIFNNLYQKIYFNQWFVVGINELKGLLLGGEWLANYSNNFALWYLQLYFIASIVFEIIIRYSKPLLKFILFVGALIVTTPFQTYLPGRPIFHINVLPAALSFMFIGYFINYAVNKGWTKEFESNILVGFLLIVIGWRISTFNFGDISNVKTFLYFVGAILTILGLYIVSSKLINVKALKYVGSRTLYILGLHGITLITTNNIVNFFFYGIDNKIILAIFSVTLSILISCGLYETYFIIKKEIVSLFNTKIVKNTKRNIKKVA